MFEKKKKCGVCGYRFAPKKEEIYTAEKGRSVMECLSKPQVQFSAVDCPRCGCQIPLAIRAPRVDDVKEREEPAHEDQEHCGNLQAG